MSDRQETPDENRKGGFATAACLVLAGLMIYMLSTGPVMKLAQYNVIAFDAADSVYAPVYWLADNFPPVDTFFTWYLDDLWRIRRTHNLYNLFA